MSLLQHPRRPSSDHLDPGADLAVDLDRELDLSSERPSPPSREGRGPGILVAAIVASSLTLAGIILLVRDDGGAAAVHEPAVPAPPLDEVVAAPAEPAPLVLPPATSAPLAPSTVASRQVTGPAVPRDVPPTAAPLEITPASIAPLSNPKGASAPLVVEPLVDDAAPFGRELPAPTFDDPAPEPEPAADPSPPTTVDDPSEPLPGIEEPTPSAPDDADEPDEPEAAWTAPDRDDPIDRAHLPLPPRPA